jgi:hypothetical protein
MVNNKCSYCKEIGHNQYTCPHGKLKITQIKQQIEICKSHPEMPSVRLHLLFKATTSPELYLLMINVFGINLKPFIRNLVSNGIITETEAKMRYKKDRITILLWHYWHSTNPVPPPPLPKTQKKLNNIVAIISIEPDLSEVDCPICVECKPYTETVTTNCNHCICKTCVDTYLNHQLKTLNFPKPLCVLCRTTITSLTFNNIEYMTELSTKYLL